MKARCHPDEIVAFGRSPMGSPLSAGRWFLGEGRIDHKLSGSTLTIQRRDAVVEHSVERHGVVANIPSPIPPGPVSSDTAT
jgi:hypothetical protein